MKVDIGKVTFNAFSFKIRLQVQPFLCAHKMHIYANLWYNRSKGREIRQVGNQFHKDTNISCLCVVKINSMQDLLTCPSHKVVKAILITSERIEMELQRMSRLL